jgi:hypothetical protein
MANMASLSRGLSDGGVAGSARFLFQPRSHKQTAHAKDFYLVNSVVGHVRNNHLARDFAKGLAADAEPRSIVFAEQCK